VLIFNPPNLRVRDLGSSNGTFVNGEKVGQCMAADDDNAEAQIAGSQEYELKSGDELRLGRLAFQISIADNGQMSELEELPLSYF